MCLRLSVRPWAGGGCPSWGHCQTKNVRAEAFPWPDIQGSGGVIGLQAPTVGESFWTVVAVMTWMESEIGGQRAPLMGFNSEGPPGKACQMSSSWGAPHLTQGPQQTLRLLDLRLSISYLGPHCPPQLPAMGRAAGKNEEQLGECSDPAQHETE